MPTLTIDQELDAPYTLTDEQIARFREQGFIKLKQVFTAELLDHFRPLITQFVFDHNNLADVPMEQRDTYQRAFIQVMNIWTHDEAIRRFAFSQRLARIAAALLEVDGVRMYHDQALYKEPGGGFTPWHADQQYWPLETDRTVTAWVPLTAVPMQRGPLAFAAGSHRMTTGRDLEISDESEALIDTLIAEGGYAQVNEPFDLGEVSFHTGWTYHRAGPNTSDHPREIMTIIYMDAAMRLAPPANFNQARDWVTWCPGAKLGAVIDTEINPVLYSRTED